jgi:RNA polymerase sigma-70 factor (ECF subfamily)
VTPSPARAPSPAGPGAGRGAGLPRDPGRATEQLYRRHGVTVFRYAWHLLGRREDAEDASQATFLAVHGALASGTAVLEPGAWVLRIARNECLGRLRQRTRVPGASSLDVVDEPAAGLERLAELRDQMRVARGALRALPVPEREAFVLREWLGMGVAEVALTMNLTPGEIERLAGRARRSLVLAVGGLESPAGCTETRAALEVGSLGRAGRVHLLRCPVCRGVRRALRPPAGTGGGVPGAVAQRLAGAVPGFAFGGGGIVAALGAKAAAAPLLAKSAALVTAALVTAGVAQQEIQHVTHHRQVAAIAQHRGGEARPLAVRPVVAAKVATTAPAPAAPRVAPTTARAANQMVALRVPAVTLQAGGGRASDAVSSTAHARSTGSRDSSPNRARGAGSETATKQTDTKHSGSSGGEDGSSSPSRDDTSPATKTRTADTPSRSGGEDGPSGSQPSSDEPAHATQPPRTRHEGDGTSSRDSGEDHAGSSGSSEDTSHEDDHSASAMSGDGGGDGAPATVPAATVPAATVPTATVPTATVPTTPVTTVTAPTSES